MHAYRPQIVLLATYQNSSDAAYEYAYDDNGNIPSIIWGSTAVTYQYNGANELVAGPDEQRISDFGIPAWFTDSCKKIGYLFPRSQGVEYAIMNLRLAYYKLNCPDMYDKLSS